MTTKMTTTWHDLYEPARTSKDFPIASIFRNWARRPDDNRRLATIAGVHDSWIIRLAHRIRHTLDSRLGMRESRVWLVRTPVHGPETWAGETFYEVALQASQETGSLHSYAISSLRRVEAEEIVTALRALGEHVIRLI